MAKIELKGFDEYEKLIKDLKGDVTKICKMGVFPGAGIAADALRAEVEALPTISDAQALANWRSGTVQPCLSESQKAGLVASIGIDGIKRESDGMIQANIGFTGYNSVRTRHFPNGQPNAEVARSLNKGTSYLQRNAFSSRAAKTARKAAKAAMKAEVEAEIAKIAGKH